MYFSDIYFLLPSTKYMYSLSDHCGLFSLHLSHRTGGAISLPYLVLHHAGWSTLSGHVNRDF